MTVNPVTDTAEVDVKKASRKVYGVAREEIGSARTTAPRVMRTK